MNHATTPDHHDDNQENRMNSTAADQIAIVAAEARDALVQAALMAGLLALTTVLASVGLDGVPPAALWALVGVLSVETVYAVRNAWMSRRLVRDLRVCPACRFFTHRADAASGAWVLCVRNGHIRDGETR